MSLTKKRNKQLWIVIILSVVVLLFAVLAEDFLQDDYITGWLVSVSQALMVFAIFRFQKLKDVQKKSRIIWNITKLVFALGVIITMFGVITPTVFPDLNIPHIARIGSFIAGLGINGLVCYTANEFDNIEEKENREHKRNKKREYRHKVKSTKSLRSSSKS